LTKNSGDFPGPRLLKRKIEVKSFGMNGRAGAAVAACLLTLVCLTPVRPQTKTTVSGRITDKDGAGLPSASVTLYPRERPGERLETVTDGDGQYHFERVATGEYLIEAKGAGFARSAALPLRVESGINPALDISLEVAGIREEVVITPSGSAQTVDEVSKAVTVVDQRELDERDEFSVASALRTVPALRVIQLGGPGARVEIMARGLRVQDTAVLVDGMRLRDATDDHGGAQTLMGSLLVTDTDRVEVLRGSGSSLYGSNAVGGAINLVSNEGGGPLHGTLLFEGGSLGFFRGRVKVAGGLGQGDRVVYSTGVAHVNVSKGIDGDDASRITSSQSRFAFHVTPRATLSARLYAVNAYAQINNPPFPVLKDFPPEGTVEAVPLSPAEFRRFLEAPPWPPFDFGAATFVPDSDDADEAEKTRFLNGALVFTAQPSENLSYTFGYQALSTRRSHTDGPAGSWCLGCVERFHNDRLDNDGLIQTFSGRADFRLDRANFITAGYELEHEQFAQRVYGILAGTPWDTDSLFDVGQLSHALFVQDQLSFLDNRLRVSAAFRSQFFSLGGLRFQPKQPPFPSLLQSPPSAFTGDASVAYFFDRTQTKLRAHVGNGQRSPSLNERFGSFYSFLCHSLGCVGDWAAFGNPYLRPERSVSFDAGVDQSLYDNRLRLSATYFYTSVRRAIVLGYDSIYYPFPFETRLYNCDFCYLNTRGGLSRGVELSATAAPTRSLDIFAAYTYTNSDERVPFYDYLRSTAVPDHQFALVASQRLGRRVLLNFDLAAASSYTAPFYAPPYYLLRPFRFDGLVKADFAANYTHPLTETNSLRVFVKVENLFGREYFEAGYRTPGRTVVGSMAFSF
jgi:vitamin B12 transporter